MNDAPNDLRVGGLEVLTTGLNLAVLDLHGGDGFWPEVQRYAGESKLDGLIDQCMGGRAAPRVWAFLESPGAGPSAAAAALAVASLLADRGQAVVLLDADEQEPRITRWLGRNEQEGWIDMVRFGASLHSASDPLPSDNRRGSVVGVGSFAPTGVTPEEVTDLLGRLRHQADDLVLVVPAKLRSLPWLEQADIRLLCWDLLARSLNDTQTVLTELDRMGAGPEALLGFGVEEYAAIQGSLQETESSAPEPAPAGEPDRTPSDDPEREPLGLPYGGSEPDPVDETPRRRTSGLFITVAVVATVAVIALALFLTGQWRRDDGPQQSVAAARIQVERTPPVVEAEPSTPDTPTDGGEMAAAPETDPTAADDPGAVIGDASDAPTGSDVPPDQDVETTDAGNGADQAMAPHEPEPELPVSETETDAAPEMNAESSPTGDQAFDLTPFTAPAAEAGWTLWLFSLPTEADARREVRELQARGLVAEFREVDLAERGRWYRVYSGSFASRDVANAAAEGLKAYLEHDWAIPTRF